VRATCDPRSVRLDEAQASPEVQSPPTSTSLTEVIAGGSAPAHTAAIPLPPPRADGHDHLPLAAHPHVLHNRPLQPKQPRPYPDTAHVASPPRESSRQEAGNPRRHAACALYTAFTGPTETSGAPVFGYSSGAVLALKAAAAGSRIAQLALYEPPFVVDDSRDRPPAELAAKLRQLIAEGRRGDAVELFQLEGVGLPEELVMQIRNAPFRPGLETIAHTLVYDAEITGDLSLPRRSRGRGVDMVRSRQRPELSVRQGVGERSRPALQESRALTARDYQSRSGNRRQCRDRWSSSSPTDRDSRAAAGSPPRGCARSS